MATAKAERARAALLRAAREVVVEHGHAAASARAVAARAEVAPGLIYYHFDDLETLLAESARALSLERAAVWAEALAPCATLTEIVEVARAVHVEEREQGSLVLLGQLLAGSRESVPIQRAVRENFDVMSGVVADALARVLADTVLADTLEPRRLARTVSAGFIGLELFDDALHDGDDLFAELSLLAGLADEVLTAGPLTAAVVRRRLRAHDE